MRIKRVKGYREWDGCLLVKMDPPGDPPAGKLEWAKGCQESECERGVKEAVRGAKKSEFELGVKEAVRGAKNPSLSGV